MKKWLALLLFICGFIVYCRRIPPFSEDIVKQMESLGQLTRLYKLGPFSVDQDMYNETLFHFIPDRKDLRKGYLVIFQQGDPGSRMIYLDSIENFVSPAYSVGYDWHGGMPLGFVADSIYGDGSPFFFLDWRDGTTYLNMLNFNAENRRIEWLYGEEGGLDFMDFIRTEFSDNSEPQFTPWFGSNTPIFVAGASFTADLSRLYVVCRYDSDDSMYEVFYDLDPYSGPHNPQRVRGTTASYTVGQDIEEAPVFFDHSSNTGFLNYQDTSDNLYRIVRKDNTTTDTVTFPEGAVSHYLSTGEFLAAWEEDIAVYDSSGGNLSTVLIRDLRPVYEVGNPDTGQKELILTYTEYMDSDSGKDQVYVYIYSYPASEFKNLGN